MLFACTLADIDLISVFFGPAAYFATHRTYTHSLPGTLAIIVLALLFTRYLSRKNPEGVSTLVLPIAGAAVVHVVLDLFQSEGVAALWPARSTRFALDWLPAIDPWILAILVAGIFFPELVRLVSAEIGAKNRSPRGRNGAIVALSMLVIYIGARALLHSGCMASLEPHSYHGESARHVGAFPDPLSLLTWHGVVETQSFLCIANVPAGTGRSFDAESAECLHKPEPSPELNAAQQTRVAQEYLRAVPFPRAVVAKTQNGYEVIIRSMRDVAEEEVRRRVAARIIIDSHFGVSAQDLVWVGEISLR
jgi:membrane-bound metal-dependent hydrolase YbcI (DUF457 family)